MSRIGRAPVMKTHTDCMSSRAMVKLPGFIDVHVHLRANLVPPTREDFDSGTPEDQQALWDNLDVIDVFATDHAPHTKQEKESENPPPGFPGLETILPLLLTAVNEGRLSLEDLIAKFYKNPKRIFGLPEQPNTYVENVREWHLKKPTVAPSVEKINGSLDGLDLLTLSKTLPDTTRHDFWENARHTNDVFSKLLAGNESKQLGVHFGEAPQNHPTSPLPRIRCDSTSNYGKDRFDVQQEQLSEVFNVAQTTCELGVTKDRPLDDLLRGKVMASVFYEVSTRDQLQLRGGHRNVSEVALFTWTKQSSSVKKVGNPGGQHPGDGRLLRTWWSLRHPEPGRFRGSPPLPEAADQRQRRNRGTSHTQALPISLPSGEEIGTVNGLTITMVGDLKHGRTVHSLARLLTLYNVNVRYVSPKSLGMPEKITKLVEAKGISQKIYDNLEDAIAETDVLYMTRIQKERTTLRKEYKSKEIDIDPRAAYFRQAEYGMYIRMALLAMVLGKC
ncbi:hypothetical protein quinque_016438 [Culex quinquefasciatus]